MRSMALLVAGELLLGGCRFYRVSERGRLFDTQDFHWLVRGETRRSDVRSKLGRPRSYQGRIVSMQESDLGTFGNKTSCSIVCKRRAWRAIGRVT